MTESLAYTPREVSPPGATLRDLMEERDWKQRELAHRLGRPVQAVNEILAGKKEITEDTALELERVSSKRLGRPIFPLTPGNFRSI